MLRQNRGFTLAEVMVSLAVVGILASIMLPVISKARPNKQKALFKKAYYVAERIVYELVNDDDLYPSKTDTVGFDNTDEVEYMGTLYGSGIPDDGDDDAAKADAEKKQKSKFCMLFARKVNTASDNVSCDSANASFNGEPSFITTDGITWYMPYDNFAKTSGTYDNKAIRVDVNGAKSPNCDYAADCPNPDRFTIYVNAYGSMIVAGQKEKEYLQSNNNLR